jgi:hypothetical protein
MKPFIIFLMLSLPALAFSQEEGYATVTAINNNTLILNNCIDTGGSFKVNQKVIIIQKEGAATATNVNAVSNKASASKQVARKYVVLTITDVEKSDNVVTAIKVSRDLQSSFTVNNYAAVDVRILSCSWNW